MADLDNIEHFVVLMLENRWFDSMLGALYPKSATFEGLAGTELNPDSAGDPVPVWCSARLEDLFSRSCSGPLSLADFYS